MKNILTGVQASGKLHIGNYFGAIEPILKLQELNESNLFLFIASYHSLTTIKNSKILKENTENLILDLLSLGINPEKINFYVQSQIPEILELTLILSNLTPMGLLERSHAFKDKVENGIKPNHGLFSYPILMAADILLFNTDIVPVGKDQIQHIEITKDIATKFNETYGNYFKLPSYLVNEDIPIIKGTDGRKMSKSYDNTIPLYGSQKEIKKSINKIVTDSSGIDDIKSYDNCNIYNLCKLFCNDDELAILRENYNTPGFGYGFFKSYLKESYYNYFKDFYEKRNYYSNNPNLVKELVEDNLFKTKTIAKNRILEIKDIVGLY